MTKAFFGHRTKNLMFYGLRCFAKAIGVENIFAVTNDGYYAMNHVRVDRKLKTDFGKSLAGVRGCYLLASSLLHYADAEHRKSMEELKPSKRAQHRRRFAKMDEMKAAVKAAVDSYKN